MGKFRMKTALAMLLSVSLVVPSFTLGNDSSVSAEENKQEFYRSFWVQAFEPGLKTVHILLPLKPGIIAFGSFRII